MYNLSSLCVQYVGNAINLSSFCFSTWATRSTCYVFVSARGQHVQHAIFLFQHVGNTFNMLSFCFSTWATGTTWAVRGSPRRCPPGVRRGPRVDPCPHPSTPGCGANSVRSSLLDMFIFSDHYQVRPCSASRVVHFQRPQSNCFCLNVTIFFSSFPFIH